MTKRSEPNYGQETFNNRKFNVKNSLILLTSSSLFFRTTVTLGLGFERRFILRILKEISKQSISRLKPFQSRRR